MRTAINRVRKRFSGKSGKDVKKPALTDIAPAERAEIYKQDMKLSGYRYAMIALGAKLATADGQVNLKELRAFPFALGIEETKSTNLAELFKDAAEDKMPAEHYAALLCNLCPNDTDLYKKSINSLIKLAIVDGPLSAEEIEMLLKVCEVFSITEESLIEMIESFIVPKGKNPREILSVNKKSSHNTIRAAYRSAMQLYHPDQFTYKNIPAGFSDLINKRINIISEAYNTIKTQEIRLKKPVDFGKWWNQDNQ